MRTAEADNVSAEQIATVLGKGSSFSGKLTFEGAVRIEGEFHGEIQTSGTLIVAHGAKVEAQVVASVVIVEGEVNGNIQAGELLEIKGQAVVIGDVRTPALSIERGAVFHGASQMRGNAPA